MRGRPPAAEDGGRRPLLRDILVQSMCQRERGANLIEESPLAMKAISSGQTQGTAAMYDELLDCFTTFGEGQRRAGRARPLK